MSKIAYIIPGFTEHADMPGYKHCATELRKAGYTVRPITITWKYKILSDWIHEAQSQIDVNEKGDILLLGFSFGAIISFCISDTVQANTQVLCSLSPYFAEDLPTIPDKWREIIGKRRITYFESVHFTSIIKNQPKHTHIVAGLDEGKEIYHRASEAHKQLPNSTLTFIENCNHNLGQKEYMEAMTTLINKL